MDCQEEVTGLMASLVLEGEKVGIDPDSLIEKMMKELKEWQTEMRQATDVLKREE